MTIDCENDSTFSFVNRLFYFVSGKVKKKKKSKFILSGRKEIGCKVKLRMKLNDFYFISINQ